MTTLPALFAAPSIGAVTPCSAKSKTTTRGTVCRLLQPSPKGLPDIFSPTQLTGLDFSTQPTKQKMKNENDETCSPENGVSQARLLDDAGISPVEVTCQNAPAEWGKGGLDPQGDDDFPLGPAYCGVAGPCEGCQ